MMNPFFFIILFALLIEYAMGVAANLLNLKSLRPEPPPTLEGMYQPEDYRKSQEYIRANTRFAFLLVYWRLQLS